MSVQSTTKLTRTDAEERAVSVLMEKDKRKYEALAHVMSYQELEDLLESTFDNYMIVPDDELPTPTSKEK